MIHATSSKSRGLAGTDRTESSTGARSSGDSDYYHRRAAQEAEAVQAASCIEARLAHEELAKAYRLVCRCHQSSADAQTTSELSAFLFISKPAD